MFRIGEFSIIAQVSGRLLRYYDEIGLLPPEFIDPQTGYRYYSASQLPRLNRILASKELGFSLEQIARLLEQDISMGELRGMLTLRKAQIEQTVQQETERLRVVESRLQQIEAHGRVQTPDVVLKSVSAQRFLSLREVLPGMDAVRSLVQSIYSTVPAKLTPSQLGQIAVVIHAPMFNPDAFDLEVGYLLTGSAPKSFRLSEDRLLSQRELPAVETMATLAHVGPLSETHREYGALGGWLEQNDWEIIGQGREILMQLPLQGKDAEAVVEIQLPVRKFSER
jgi:DNA-binding transcriptional MerR regulator